MKTDKDKRRFFRKELKKYEKIMRMAETEREALHEWAGSGRIVHEDGGYACHEGGAHLDYPNEYREEKKENKKTVAVSGENRKKYLCETYGAGREIPPVPSYEELKGRMRLLYKRYMLYWEFLVSSGLREDAEEYVQDRMDEDVIPFDMFD